MLADTKGRGGGVKNGQKYVHVVYERRFLKRFDFPQKYRFFGLISKNRSMQELTENMTIEERTK